MSFLNEVGGWYDFQALKLGAENRMSSVSVSGDYGTAHEGSGSSG